MSRHFYNILNSVSKSPVIDTGDLTEAAELLVFAALDGLTIHRAGIWLFDEDHQSMRCRLLVDVNQDQAPPPPPFTREQFPSYFSALDEERVLVVESPESDARLSNFFHAYLKPLNISAMLDAPIRHRGKMVGVLCCEHQGTPRRFLNEEISFMSTLADLYGRAISSKQRQDFEDQLRDNNEQLESKILERTRWLEDALRNLTHTQEKLIESEKLASIGRMVSGLAHEINTPLGISVTSASHCETELKRIHKLYDQRELSEDDFKQFLLSMTEGLHLVSHNLYRATNLVHNFRLTGTIHISDEEETFELKNCLDIIINSLKPLIKNHTFECYFSSAEPIRVNSYPGVLAQILTNLVTNSIHHGFAAQDAGLIRLNVTAHQDTVHLNYSDSGKGIHPEHYQKIFEPFFTTARKTGGSGLGLSIVHNLVTQKLKGTIDVVQSKSSGAEFMISFPINIKKPIPVTPKNYCE